MIKSRLIERRTAKGFCGAVDDALVLDVIGAYRKQLQKAAAEFEKVGDARRRAGGADPLRDRLLRAYPAPRPRRRRAARRWSRERLAALGIADAKQVGRLVGDVMKTHKGQVEAADVKRIAEELLAE